MMLLTAFLAVAGAQVQAAPPSPEPPAAAPSSPPAKAVAQKSADPDKIVCKSIVTTGTRFADRDCRRKSQWDQMTADSRQATTDTINRQAVMFKQ